jgi:hypothetical protein
MVGIAQNTNIKEIIKMVEFRSRKDGRHYPVKGGKQSYPADGQFIKKATCEKTKGALHEQLGVPKNQEIPITLEEKIVRAPVGSTIENPTTVGKKQIKVTKLVKSRSNFALNIRPDATKERIYIYNKKGDLKKITYRKVVRRNGKKMVKYGNQYHHITHPVGTAKNLWQIQL